MAYYTPQGYILFGKKMLFSEIEVVGATQCGCPGQVWGGYRTYLVTVAERVFVIPAEAGIQLFRSEPLLLRLRSGQISQG